MVWGGVEAGEENPALSVEAPLSTIRVCAGGGGPEDFVRRCEGAIEGTCDDVEQL